MLIGLHGWCVSPSDANRRVRELGEALFLGYAFEASLFSVGLIWLPGAIADFLRLSGVLSIGYVGIIIAYLSLFPAVNDTG